MIPVTPQSGGGSYGGFASYGNNQYGGINSDLLQMLHQLIQHRLGVSNIGANKYQVDPNGFNIGVIDDTGNYRPGF